MINFQPDICASKDSVGWGMWLDGHYREHLQMITLCSNLSTPVLIPDYDLFGWDESPRSVDLWLDHHQSIHELLRKATNVEGYDLSLVDFGDDDQFQSWLQFHATEHQILRQILGIV